MVYGAISLLVIVLAMYMSMRMGMYARAWTAARESA